MKNLRSLVSKLPLQSLFLPLWLNPSQYEQETHENARSDPGGGLRNHWVLFYDWLNVVGSSPRAKWQKVKSCLARGKPSISGQQLTDIAYNTYVRLSSWLRSLHHRWEPHHLSINTCSFPEFVEFEQQRVCTCIPGLKPILGKGAKVRCTRPLVSPRRAWAPREEAQLS